MDRVLRGIGATIRLSNYDANGTLVNAGGGNGSAAVTDSAGVAVAGSPFTATNSGTGLYDVSLPTTLVVLDTYTVVWTMPDATTRRTEFEMVGSFLFTQADVRALDPVLASETEFPDALLVEARENTEQRFQEVAEVSFTLRGERLYLDGIGADRPRLQTKVHELRSVITCKIDGATVTDVTAYPHGTLYRDAGWPEGQRNIEALVEHGYRTVPAPIRRVGLLYARTVLLRSALEQSDRATAVFTDIGGYRLSLAGRDGPTGIPEVDAVLDQFGRRQAGALA